MFNRKNQIQDMDAYVEERLSDYLDGTLSDKERQIVEAHLASSERARASYESLKYTVNLLKQTPAPALPRQFTLPVTMLAPARTTPAWLVWSLRGIAVAATAAFVILLTTTLLRQNVPSQALEQAAPMSAAQAPAEPSAMVALAQTPLPTFAPQAQDDQDNARAAPTASPIMITVEPPPDTATPEPTAEPAATNKVQESSQSSAPAQDVPPPPPAAAEEPTVSIITALAEPTPTPVRENSDATAAGSAPEANTPVIAPTNAESTTQRSSVRVAIEGVITATRLRVRRGPGIEYAAIGGLANGDIVRILGRDLTGAWLVIEYPQDEETGIGWIGALFVDEGISVDTLPIYAAPETLEPESQVTGQPPLPTETPAEIDEPEPTPTETETDVPNREATDESIAPATPETPTETPEA